MNLRTLPKVELHCHLEGCFRPGTVREVGRTLGIEVPSDPATFRRMNGGFDGLDRVLDGIRAAREAGLVPVKVNAVVQRGVNDGQVLDLARHFRGSGVVVRFIEYMDVGNRNHWQPGLVVPSRAIRDALAAAWPLVPLAPSSSSPVEGALQAALTTEADTKNRTKDEERFISS